MIVNGKGRDRHIKLRASTPRVGKIADLPAQSSCRCHPRSPKLVPPDCKMPGSTQVPVSPGSESEQQHFKWIAHIDITPSPLYFHPPVEVRNPTVAARESKSVLEQHCEEI